MIDIKKNRSDFGLNDIVITQGEKKFQLLFGGDGYLYWTMIDLEQDTNGIVRFPITKENYMLYSLIEDVYEKVRNCQVFDVSDVELEFCDTAEERAALFAKKKSNDDLKRFSAYKKLYDQNTGIISWHDDESIYDEGNVVNIIPKDEEFILEFVLGVHCDAMMLLELDLEILEVRIHHLIMYLWICLILYKSMILIIIKFILKSIFMIKK